MLVCILPLLPYRSAEKVSSMLPLLPEGLYGDLLQVTARHWLRDVCDGRIPGKANSERKEDMNRTLTLIHWCGASASLRLVGLGLLLVSMTPEHGRCSAPLQEMLLAQSSKVHHISVFYMHQHGTLRACQVLFCNACPWVERKLPV